MLGYLLPVLYVHFDRIVRATLTKRFLHLQFDPEDLH